MAKYIYIYIYIKNINKKSHQATLRQTSTKRNTSKPHRWGQGDPKERKPPKETKRHQKPRANQSSKPSKHLQAQRTTRKPPRSHRRGRGDTTPPTPNWQPQATNHHKPLPTQTQDGLHLPLIEIAGIGRALSQESLPS